MICWCFFLQLYIQLFLCIFSNFITILGIFKFHPRFRLLCLSQSHYHLNPDFYNHRFRYLIPPDVLPRCPAVWPVICCYRLHGFQDEFFYPCQVEGETHRQAPVGGSCIVQAAHLLTCQRTIEYRAWSTTLVSGVSWLP